MAWNDFSLFILLFALFAYVFLSVTITNLHKAYLAFHFSMMLWPFCQFAIKATDNVKIQLFYVKLAFVDMALFAVGWLLFTLFLTGRSLFLRRKRSIAIYVPAVLAAFTVIMNPNAMFVQPLEGGYIQRAYGPLFWFIITILIGYVVVSLSIMFLTLLSHKASRLQRQVKQVLKGMLVMTAFTLFDIFLYVIDRDSLPDIPGLTSLGILVAAVCFVIAITRDKALDIVNIAHKDVINTMALGVVVLDDHDTIIEINQSLPRHIVLHIGDRFDIAAILPEEQGDELARAAEVFLQAYRELPLKRSEIEVAYPEFGGSRVHIHADPIMAGDTKVGRIITFQDMSELRSLIDETNYQNEILQNRNHSLREIKNELYYTNQKLEQMAITDNLTGCYNRHYLTQQLEREVIKNMGYHIPFAILLFDIDYFKLVNDNYGHLVGDEVLCSTVDTIKQSLRKTDILARYGGEEFIIYLPNTTPAQANLVAERVKTKVESNQMIVRNVSPPLSITISIGLLSIHTFTIDHSYKSRPLLNELFHSVDQALYQAKRNGRNQIVRVVR
ncbi:histidine kinase N-terminal 7TM domain-containing diguanylate cyclase [Paenibacillus mendelii]|uniref:Diguanylate cyclase n=1 Tax=Paenibacillus mendelii TaxID=206163 RepID=A0ABV6JP22_9BACL|nr:diguanylate cyclase [Paenibacillus mendelii]MCQ6560599.1 diguanylate cyclase [Paenibacillus mendelii]